MQNVAKKHVHGLHFKARWNEKAHNQKCLKLHHETQGGLVNVVVVVVVRLYLNTENHQFKLYKLKSKTFYMMDTFFRFRLN